jgi:hypothetical protein
MNGYVFSCARVCSVCACAAIALAACGPGDTAASDSAVNATQSNATQSAAAPGQLNVSASALGASVPLASLAGNPANPSTGGVANPADSTQDSAAIVSAQASLASDNQQVAPVLHYAPGDDSH